MRKDDSGRTALLRYVRQNLRRETLPAPAREPARRGNLLEVRQPRAVHTAAEDSDELAIACHCCSPGLGLLLFYASLCLILALFRTPAVQNAMVVFGLLLAGLWWLWSKLPDWLQEALRALWKRKENKDD